MKKQSKVKKASATAKCLTFDIEMTASFQPRGLDAEEVQDIQRKLKDGMAQLISKLPFSETYPFEVQVR